VAYWLDQDILAKPEPYQNVLIDPEKPEWFSDTRKYLSSFPGRDKRCREGKYGSDYQSCPGHEADDPDHHHLDPEFHG
jgi:hypothetical protein